MATDNTPSNCKYEEESKHYDDNSSDKTTSSASETIDFHSKQQFIQSLPESIDVVIVGTSCGALLLACELALQKYNFIILDSSLTTLPRSRSVILNARSMEILSNIGIHEDILLHSNIVRGLKVMINENTVLDAKFSSTKSRFPFFLVLDQCNLKKILRERLEQLGHTICSPLTILNVELYNNRECDSPLYSESKFINSLHDFGSNSVVPLSTMRQSVRNTLPGNQEVNYNSSKPFGSLIIKTPSFFNEDGNCMITVKAMDGCEVNSDDSDSKERDSSYSIRCKFIVSSDADQEIIRKAAEISYNTFKPTVEFLIADIAVNWKKDITPDRFYLLQNTGGNMLMIPLPSDEWRIILMRHSIEENNNFSYMITPLPTPDYTELEHIVLSMVPDAVLEQIYWTESFRISNCEADEFYKSMVILMGEAAHVHPPVLNDSMNADIQDAHNLAWKLKTVLQGGSLVLMDSYSLERKQASNLLSRRSKWLFDSFSHNSSISRWSLFTLSYINWPIQLLGNTFFNDISDIEISYKPSLIISNNNLSNKSVTPGHRFYDFSVIMIPSIKELISNSDTPKNLANYLGNESHSLLLFFHVLPPGTRVRSFLGCEKDQESVRWSMNCFNRSLKLARQLNQLFETKKNHINESFRVIWVFCGLVNFKSRHNNVLFEQIKDHIPNKLKQNLYMSKVANISYIAVDYENELYDNLGLRLADPDGYDGDTKSAAFILLRPDRYITVNGYAGDSLPASLAFDYVLNLLT